MARRPELNTRFTSRLELATRVLGQVRAIEAEEITVHFEMIGLDRKPDEKMPPAPGQTTERTYGQRLEELAAQRQRLETTFPGEYKLAQEVHDREAAGQEQALEAVREAAAGEAEASAPADEPPPAP